MNLNYIGFVAALSTFFGVWFGHVAVRRVESLSPTIWLPTTVFAIIAITVELLSLFTSSLLLSTAAGILGLTFLWDALEITRQQNRIKKGHAPANLKNPRHRRLMQEHASMTTIDLLKREPLGKPVSHSEAIRMVTEHQLPLTNH
jgi:uncharacterized protein DUF4491